MEKDESKKDLIFPKEDIFLEHLNHNNNPLKNEEFIKGSLETFDKFFSEEETINTSNKIVNKSIDYSPLLFRKNCLNFNEKIVNGGKDKDNLKPFINDKINDNNSEILKSKTQLFNTQQESEMNNDLKKRKLIMNRESAKKSRLKKKKYIENLEKEYLNINCHKDKEILSLKKEEFSIISNNLEKDPKHINDFINKQKKILQNLLVKQIELLTPLYIKDFQNKFLKLEEIKKDDSVSVIKNKTNNILEAIIELYDIDIKDDKSDKNLSSKNSKGYNIYIFYNSLKSYIEQYEFIFNQLTNYNSL